MATTLDAIVVDLQRLTGLGAAIKGAKAPYAIAKIGDRMFGRSSPLTGAELDLTKEKVSWKLELPGATSVPVVIEIYDELGDAGSKKLASESKTVGLADVGKKIEIGSSFKVLCEVIGLRLDRVAAAQVVTRTATGTTTRATLTNPNSAKVELTAIRGLYKPVAIGQPGRARAEATPGYISQDNMGRAFTNCDLALKWTKDKQLIELSAKVTIVSGKFPQDGKVKWTLLDVDDPTNDDPGFHVQWGRYVDAKDYDATGKHQGSQAADNEGTPAKNPPWEQVGPFKLSGATKEHCLTEIVSGVSKVTFHCPDVVGDNFIIAVEIDTKTKLSRQGHQTGVITMWNRIRVDNIRMNGALELPMDDLPIYFEPCCVQMDCEPERIVPDKQFLAPSRELLSTSSSAYVSSVFKRKPGWFCLVAALEPHPLPAIKGQSVFKGPVTLGTTGAGATFAEYIDIPGSHSDADYAELTFKDGTIGFRVRSPQPFPAAAPTHTRCWLEAHDAQPEFTAGDGSIEHSYTVSYEYSPRFTKLGANVGPRGYGMPDDVDAEVMTPGAFYVGGISPTVNVGGKSYFAGRTVVFTHHNVFYDPTTNMARPTAHKDMLEVMVHELVHAFGMPHKCGYFNFRAPRDKTCCMNYRPNWMVDDARQLIPKTNRKTGIDLCGRHLKEVRRVHLEDNKGLGWK